DDPIDRGSAATCGSSPEGSELWRHDLGEVDVSVWTSVAVDPRGGTFVSSAPGGTIKVDHEGRMAWTKLFGGVVATDGDGHAYVSGTFSGTAMFDTCAVVAESATDAYMAEIDADGSVVRCVSIGGATE